MKWLWYLIFNYKYQLKSEDLVHGDFDLVIIASPLELSHHLYIDLGYSTNRKKKKREFSVKERNKEILGGLKQKGNSSA